MTGAEFKDESTSQSPFRHLAYLDGNFHIDKRGVTKIDGSAIQLYSTAPSHDPEQTASLTGTFLQFYHSAEQASNLTLDGMHAVAPGKGIAAESGNIEMYGHPDDDRNQPERYMQFSIDNVTMGGQQIHGVLAGNDDTDAVNVSQLKEVESKISNIGQTTISAANLILIYK